MIPVRLKSLRSERVAIAPMLILALFALPAEAQRAGAGNEQPAAPTTAAGESKVIPTIRTQIYDRLAEAEVCMDMEDWECAEETLARVEQIRDLNNYETAQLWNFRAFMYLGRDQFEPALEAYETILSLPFEDMPDGMIQQSMKNLATIYLQLEQYADGLETYLRWMELPSVVPNSGDWYLLASIYYQMEQYADGIPPVQRAIELANERGELGEENWYQLLYVFYFQLEQTDNVIDTLTFMVENFTKKDWVIALAQQLSGQGREDETLSLYEAAYDQGWLTRGPELVQLANLYLNADTPYKAAKVLESGLEGGVIESSELNWRLLAQAWQMAQEHEVALPAFERASTLADDGEVDRMLTQSLIRLARWEECVDIARRALDRDLDRPDLMRMYLGQCLMTAGRYDEARTAFQAAARDDRSQREARSFLGYLETLVARDQTNREALAQLERLRAN